MIELKPDDRIGGFQESRRPVILYVSLALLVAVLIGAAVYYPRFPYWWQRLTESNSQQTKALPNSQETTALFEKLGIPTLPPSVAVHPTASSSFDQLRREPCDRTAAFTLSRNIATLGYRRESANALIRFGSACGNDQDAYSEAAARLMEIGDFAGAVQLRTSLVEEVPASAEFRLLRAQALESLGKREQALPDYFSTIQPSVI